MKKSEPRWFKHFCNFQDNLKLRDLNDGYFETGLAVFYCVKEKLMVSSTGALSFDDLIKLLRFNYRWQCPEKLPEIVTRCIQLGLLDKDKDDFVSSKEIYECRGAIEKKIQEASDKGEKSAALRAGGYNEFKFPLKDGKIWKLPNNTLEEWRLKFPQCDEILKEIQDIHLNDENQREPRRYIKKHIEAYLITETGNRKAMRKNEREVPF